MMIDTHIHYGKFGIFSLDENKLIEQMDKYKIDIGIISTIECCEFRSSDKALEEFQHKQLDANERLLDFITRHSGRFYASFWCKPYTENNYQEVFDFLKKHRDTFVGLKLHPFYSQLALEDKRYLPYIEIAKSLKLPVSIHSAADELSNPVQVLNMAKAHTEVEFIMVHMGLCSDNELAIECVASADNLYGDTTWVPYPKVMKAMEKCGSGKIVYGSDAPVDADKTYEYYEPMFADYASCTSDDLENVMYKNAKRLFRL